MNGSVHYAEHTVTKKYEGKYKAFRLCGILLFVAAFILIAVIMIALIGAGAFIWLVPLSPTAIFIAKKLIYDRFFNTEFTYIISGGTFTLQKINSERYKRTLIQFKLSDASAILPYQGIYKERIDALSYAKRIEAVSSMNCEDIYAIFANDTLIFIEGIAKTVRLMCFYNKSSVAIQTKI